MPRYKRFPAKSAGDKICNVFTGEQGKVVQSMLNEEGQVLYLVQLKEMDEGVEFLSESLVEWPEEELKACGTDVLNGLSSKLKDARVSDYIGVGAIIFTLGTIASAYLFHNKQ